MNIFVITIIGIAIFSSVIFGFFMTGENPLIQFPRPEHYEIEIIGLKDTYLVGEPYSFSFILSGFGSTCGGYIVTFPLNKTDNMTVGEPPGCLKSMLTDFVLDFRKVYGKRFGHVALQETGNYTVTVSFEKGDNGPTVAKKSFLVIEGECNEKNTQQNIRCFVEAFQSCMTTRINQVWGYTEEGDPILLTAMIERENETCNVHVIIDNKYDKFGIPEIYQTFCANAEMWEENWIINQCEDDGVYTISYIHQDWEILQNLFKE
jgi:hypothetical protein